MGSVNKVFLVGNLARDPEIRSMPNGDRVSNLTLVTSETWRDKSSGERKEKAEFHRVTIMNDNIVKVVENYVKKGSLIALEGSLQTRKWTDKDGVEKYTTEVLIGRFNGSLTLLGGKPESSSDGGGFSKTDTGGQASSEPYDLNDDIPF